MAGKSAVLGTAPFADSLVQSLDVLLSLFKQFRICLVFDSGFSILFGNILHSCTSLTKQRLLLSPFVSITHHHCAERSLVAVLSRT